MSWQKLAKDARTSKADQNRIRRSAKLQPCTVNIPGVCNWNPETTVLAHAPCPDKGQAWKSPDWWAAYACSSCHDALDQRGPSPLLPDDAAPHWMFGIYRTQKLLQTHGLMRVGK